MYMICVLSYQLHELGVIFKKENSPVDLQFYSKWILGHGFE